MPADLIRGQDRTNAEMFGNVVRNGIPVMNLKYTANRTALINLVMNEMPNQMGLGAFAWEPTRYSDTPMFDRSGSRYTSNSRLDEVLRCAEEFNATLPDFVQQSNAVKHPVSGTEQIRLPVEQLKKGLYLVEISSDDLADASVFKLVK